MRLKRTEISKLNNEILKLIELNHGPYFRNIPIEDIRNILKKYDMDLLNEDETSFEGIFCGESGRTHIDYGKPGEMVENSVFFISWYKLSTSYDINMYFS